MNKKHLFQAGGCGFHPLEKFFGIGMGAQGVERIDLGLDVLRNAENSNRFPAVAKLAAQGVLGLISGEKHGVSAVADVMAQVVQDAACLAHSGGRNDNERAAEV